jgi:hypothetical protein
LPLAQAERHVNDVLNVFTAPGLTATPVNTSRNTRRCVRAITLNSLLKLICCRPVRGRLRAKRSSDEARCDLLMVEVFRHKAPPDGWPMAPLNGYNRSHEV